MKSSIGIAAAIFIVPIISFAQQSQQYTTIPASSTEVQAGMAQLQAGGYNPNLEGADYPAKLQAVNARLYPQRNLGVADPRDNVGMTRAQVQAELAQLLQTGYNPFDEGEVAYPARFLAAQARIRAQQSGVMPVARRGNDIGSGRMKVAPARVVPFDDDDTY